MTLPTNPKKVIKPFFNARQAAAKQTAAKELQERQAALRESQAATQQGVIKQLNESAFDRVKSKKILRREANQAKRVAFMESLTFMIASIAYNAMPVDNKAPLREETEDGTVNSQPFENMFQAVSTTINKDPEVSMMIGDLYSRNSIDDIGGLTSIDASQMAVGISSLFNPQENQTFDTLDALNDNPDPAVYTTQNYIDQLLAFGDISGGKQKPLGNIGGPTDASNCSDGVDSSIPVLGIEGQSNNTGDQSDINESVYREFVRTTSAKVEAIVLRTLKEETDAIDLTTFLAEEGKDNMYNKSANKNLLRKATKPSVFREVFKTVSVLAENTEYRKEFLMPEAIALYTLLETLNTLGLLNKTKEKVMLECVELRRAKRLNVQTATQAM